MLIRGPVMTFKHRCRFRRDLAYIYMYISFCRHLPSVKKSLSRPDPRESGDNRRSRDRCRSRARTWLRRESAGASSGRRACTDFGPAISTWWAPWETVWWPATVRSKSTPWERWSSIGECLGRQVRYFD